MGKKELTPKIRFAGFTDPWEQRKLNEYLCVSKAKNKDETFGKEDVLSVSGDYGVVNQIEFQGRSFAGVSVAPYGVVDTGDVIYTKSPLKANPYGIIKTNKGKPGIVSTLYAVYKPLENTCPEFVQIYFEQDSRMNNYMHPLVNKGAKNDMKVSDENALKGEVIFPSKEEQEQISEYFEKLDNLITLHQRKYEKLQNIKKSMLEKMFPRDGGCIPEVRFAGFTDPWEQRKVGDYYEFKNGLNKGKEFFGSGTPIVNFTDVFHNRGIETAKLKGRVTLEPSEIKNYEVKKGDLFFTRTSETIEEIGYPSVMLDEPENTVFSGFVLRGRCFLDQDPLDDLFKKYVFFTESFRNEMLKKSSMTTRALTSGTSIKEMVFFHPSSKVEQRKIGELLSQIDNSITLHQRKLEKLKNIKKSMLENMFV